jgi:hypothetical protein
MIVSSGGICERYEVIGMVVGFASTQEGCSGGIHVEQTYDAALKRLLESANAQGATGLLFVNFQNRFASAAGLSGVNKRSRFSRGAQRSRSYRSPDRLDTQTVCRASYRPLSDLRSSVPPPDLLIQSDMF